MLRIVDGIVFEGKPAADRYVVTWSDFGNGHREACVQRAIDWVEDGPLDPDSILAQVARGEREDPAAEEKREANARRAARRAKTNVRRRCKALGLDTLLTLTYRGLQTDLELCELHLKLFLEKMRKAFRDAKLGEFCYVGCFEEQKRGAWHVHLACHKLPATLLASNGVKVKSYNIIRALWRKVTGEWGGTINESAKKAHSKRSAAKVAAYISKYVTKMFAAGEDHSKRYRWSRAELPERIREEVSGSELRDLIARAVTLCAEGGRVLATSWLSRFGDVFFVASESPPVRVGAG